MATKREKKALLKLLDELETVRYWLRDTAYPRRSRERLDEALAETRAAFGLPDASPVPTTCDERGRLIVKGGNDE